MMDYLQPVRTKRSQRRLFVTGWDRGYVLLDTKEHGINTGFRYDSYGRPVDGCPWGDVEEVPLEDAIVSTEWVEKRDAVDHNLRAQRQREAAELMERNNANNPLWGMF